MYLYLSKHYTFLFYSITFCSNYLYFLLHCILAWKKCLPIVFWGCPPFCLPVLTLHHFTSFYSSQLHFTSHYLTSPLYNTLTHFTFLPHSTSLHSTSLHFTPLYLTSPHYTLLHPTLPNSTLLYFTSPLYLTLPHFTSLPHYQWQFKSWAYRAATRGSIFSSHMWAAYKLGGKKYI